MYDAVDEIGREFEKLLEEHKGLIKARVTTAVDIENDYKELLVRKLEDVTGKKIRLVHSIDDKIIGGIIVQLNNKIIDRSVRFQLSTLKHDLMALKVY